MNKREIVLTSVLLATIVVGMFVYTYIAKERAVNKPLVTAPALVVESPYNISNVTATHFFADDTHTIVGELTLPTPCDLLTYESAVRESFPETVVYMFNVINNANDCEKIPTTQRFQITAKASDQAQHQATFMGQAIELNLREPAPGETIEDFVLFQKG